MHLIGNCYCSNNNKVKWIKTEGGKKNEFGKVTRALQQKGPDLLTHFCG